MQSLFYYFLQISFLYLQYIPEHPLSLTVLLSMLMFEAILSLKHCFSVKKKVRPQHLSSRRVCIWVLKVTFVINITCDLVVLLFLLLQQDHN